MTKDGFLRKYEYVYDGAHDCYLCPENQILSYCTTNRDGYKEYLSCGEWCASCPSIHECTESKNHVKAVMRHVWEEYMEMAEDIRHTLGNKAIYGLKKETIERIFGTAKEQHGFRYTQYIGKARMEMKAGIIFACIRVFYRAGCIESWGRGIYKICDACKMLGVDEPKYIVHGGDIMIKFNALQSAKVSESIVAKSQDVTMDVTKETEILALLREDASMTTTEMAQKLSVNRRTVQRELEKLKKKNCIERKGGRRYGYWEIHE